MCFIYHKLVANAWVECDWVALYKLVSSSLESDVKNENKMLIKRFKYTMKWKCGPKRIQILWQHFASYMTELNYWLKEIWISKLNSSEINIEEYDREVNINISSEFVA